jgi:hypothetical protein
MVVGSLTEKGKEEEEADEAEGGREEDIGVGEETRAHSPTKVDWILSAGYMRS